KLSKFDKGKPILLLTSNFILHTSYFPLTRSRHIWHFHAGAVPAIRCIFLFLKKKQKGCRYCRG
ncbi:hypothetical protein, partial [Flavobacterium branchiophilum]